MQNKLYEPDCRPVSVGSVMERMFSGAALHKHSSQLLSVYEPQQLGFTQNGVELLPLMVRTQLDLYPSHCCVKMDKENHFGVLLESTFTDQSNPTAQLA